MKNRVFVVSRFEGVKNKLNQFHFLGFYKGVYIKKIYVNGGIFEKGEDYVIAVSVTSYRDDYISGNFIKSKKLFT